MTWAELMDRHERWLRRTPFERFHDDNPHIFIEFARRALALQAAGARRIAVAKIREEIRADVSIRTLSDEYKLSNDYTPDYARMLVSQYPSLKKLIVLKARKTGEVDD